MTHVDAIDRFTTQGFVCQHIYFDVRTGETDRAIGEYGDAALAKLESAYFQSYAFRLDQAIAEYSRQETYSVMDPNVEVIAARFNVPPEALEDALNYADLCAMDNRDNRD